MDQSFKSRKPELCESCSIAAPLLAGLVRSGRPRAGPVLHSASMPEDFSSYPPPPAGPYTAAPAQPYGYGYATPPPPPLRKKHSAGFWALVWTGAILGVIFLLGFLSWAAVKSVSNDSDSDNGSLSSEKIGVIEVSGVLLSAEGLGQQLRKFGDDNDVKAIILHINSPGGGAAVSQELYNEVLRIRKEKHKQIIASIETVGASGAYYIASACDRIYANDASVVGSIGVIMEWTQYGDLLRWAKLKPVVLHAGELKDAGDPSHDLTPKEQAYFQGLIDNMYSQFIHDVASGRNVPDDRIKPLATGQVWTGQQARALGLIDREGGYRVALMDTAKEAGIKGEPGIRRPAKKRTGLLATLTSEDSDTLLPTPAKILNQAPGFYFLWK